MRSYAAGYEPSTRTWSQWARRPVDRLGDALVADAALEIDEEDVVAEAVLARPRLDAREVHAAERELRQAAHEPAGLRPRPRPENASDVLVGAADGRGARAARATRSASRCRRRPRCRRAATSPP